MHAFRLLFVLALWASQLVAARADYGLPTVHLSTADGKDITTRAWHSGTRVRLVAANGHTLLDDRRAAVRGRGHSSLGKPKTPFALKLSHAARPLGLPRGRRWVLLANFMDHSLLRNRLALAVASEASEDWTPRGHLVWVVQNGRPMGCYLLTQQIEVGRNAVHVARRGGFLAEMDAYPSTHYSFATPLRRLPVHVKSPRRPTRRQRVRIAEHLAATERALYAARPNPATIDSLLSLHSFADYYLVQELCQNAECNGPRSTYLFLARDHRLHAGPAWDFDLAFIDVGLDAGGDLRPARFARPDVRALTVDSLYADRAVWFPRLLALPAFEQRLRRRWQSLEPHFVALADSLMLWADIVAPAAEEDQKQWGAKDPARFDTCLGFRASVEHLRRTYLRRIDVLRQRFAPSKSMSR